MESKKAKTNINKNCNELLSLTLVKETIHIVKTVIWICREVWLIFCQEYCPSI